MPKAPSPFPLTLPLREPGTPAGRWLYAALRGEILEGRLRPGARLPATRELAATYGLARGTIVQAFEELKAEGYLEAGVGSGTFVTRVLPDRLLTAGRSERTPSAPGGPRERRLSSYGRRLRAFDNLDDGPVRAFRSNLPALDLFPTTLWARIASRRLHRVSAKLLLACPPLGYMPLREAVADYLATSRGVRCVAEQVVMVSGTQEALDLVARLLLDPKDRVAIEDPGYPGAALAFEALGATLVPIPVDAEGMTLDRAALAGVRLAYVTPAHQFPLGIDMSLPRRLALLDWAASSGAVIFEDDYDSEYRYSGRPVPALQGLDRHGQVIFVGSFSKVLFPSLRMGYLVVPPDLVDRFAAVLSLTHRHAPLLAQAVLADFIVEGHFGRHIRRMREIYSGRRAALLDHARRHLAGRIEISGAEAGLQTLGWLTAGIDGETAALAAAERGIEVTPAGRYSRLGAAANALLLGFAAVEEREIRRGVEALAAVLSDRPRP